MSRLEAYPLPFKAKVVGTAVLALAAIGCGVKVQPEGYKDPTSTFKPVATDCIKGSSTPTGNFEACVGYDPTSAEVILIAPNMTPQDWLDGATPLATATSAPEPTATVELQLMPLDDLIQLVRDVVTKYPSDLEAQNAVLDIEDAKNNKGLFESNPAGVSVNAPISRFRSAQERLGLLLCKNPTDSQVAKARNEIRAHLQKFALDNVGADGGLFTQDKADNILSDLDNLAEMNGVPIPPQC